MENTLDYFDLDLLPIFSPGKIDDGLESKVKRGDNFDFIMSGANDHPQPCFSKGGEGLLNDIDLDSSDEAYALEAVNMLQLPAKIDPETTSEDTAGDHTDNEVPLSQDQLQLILQGTGIIPPKNEQDSLQPFGENIAAGREGNCSIIVINLRAAPPVENAIKVEATPAVPVGKTDGIVSLTTGFQGQDLPSGAKRSSSRRCRGKRRVKAYELPKLEDAEEEKKRQNAINSKNNRDRKKQERTTLKLNLEEAIRERDELQSNVEKEKTKNCKLVAKLKLLKEAFEGV